jgi:hypothetical protein
MNIVGASASDDLVDHRPPGPRPGRSSNRELDAEPLGDTAELLRVALRLFQHGAKVALVLGQPVDDLVHRLQGLYAGLGPSLPLFLYGDEAEVARLVSGQAQPARELFAAPVEEYGFDEADESVRP